MYGLIGRGPRVFHTLVKAATSIQPCCVHTSSIINRKRKAHAGDILKLKFLKGESERIGKGASGKTAAPLPGSGVGSEFRLARLNKIFLDKITDILSTMDVAMQLADYGVSIFKVELSPSLSLCRVFWSTSHLETNTGLEETMELIAGPLKDELQKLNVMSVVPSIVFVRDEKNVHLAEIDRRLAIADLGDDFEPTDKTYYQRSNYLLKKEIDDDLWRKIEELSKLRYSEKTSTDEDNSDKSNSSEDGEIDDIMTDYFSIPPMTNKINHVHWDKTMDKIKHGMEQSKAMHRSNIFENDITRPVYQSKRASSPPTKGVPKLLLRLNKMKLRRHRNSTGAKIQDRELIYLEDEFSDDDDNYDAKYVDDWEETEDLR